MSRPASGPSPYYFVRVPDEESVDIREVAAMASCGWGVIPVEARIGEVAFQTSFFPKDSGYLLPLKAAVHKASGLSAGDDVTVRMTVLLLLNHEQGLSGVPLITRSALSR
ncbi:DUF1905 domain-containing protein [Streptomyces sp. NPDC002935]|uniref:DUF1905 domain-containing protein n=1 Tax=unclassified Streptomyces TaxID=2593676 RepID=UPI003319A1F1